MTVKEVIETLKTCDEVIDYSKELNGVIITIK